MDELEKNQNEFDLEDILKEFGDEAPEAPAAQPLDEPDAPEVTQDTVRLDAIAGAVKKQETGDATVRFQPVGEEEELPQLPEEPAPETVEPFSEDWEPEYDEPMGEYVPQEPIIFRPKSRLRELKAKLVAGPEKKYYELVEKGLGKLQLAILLNLFVAVVSAASTAAYAFGDIPADRMKLLIFWQFLSLLLSALLGSYQLLEGISDLVNRRFSLNTLLAFTFTACLADGILCLYQQRVPCCAAFSLTMTMSLWGAYHKRNTQMGQMDTLRKAVRLDSVAKVDDYYEGRPGFLRGEGQVEDFMDHYDDTSGPDKVLSVYAIVCLFVSLAMGIAAGVLNSLSAGFQTFAVALLVAIPSSTYIALSRPAALLQRRLHKLGSVICGWRGVKGLCGQGVFPLGDRDLFPSGTVKMNGVKFYGDREPDEVVAYAAALMAAAGDGTAPLFAQLLESRNGHHYDAVNLTYYSGGIGCEVNGEAVLMGVLPFMQDMGVDMPEGTRVSQAVYAAIDGELCGVFAITYGKVKGHTSGLTTLCAYRGLTPILTTGDFMLTESFLRSKFGVNTRRMGFPDHAVRRQLAKVEPDEEAQVLALTTGDSLAGAAYAVTGARALRSSCITGTVVHMIGGILGMLAVLALTIVGAEEILTPVNILLYDLIWLVPALLVTEWTRSV